MNTTNMRTQPDKEIFDTFNILLETKFVEYAYADLFADVLGVSQKKLNEVTRNFCGKTACQLVDRKIVTEAMTLLSSPQKKVQEIAWQLGYEDQYYFSRMFKRLTGNSPRQFRREIGILEK